MTQLADRHLPLTHAWVCFVLVQAMVFLFFFATLHAASPLFGKNKPANGRIVIVTGDESGTYFQIGQDLKKLGQRHGFEVVIRASKGALDNLVSIVNDEHVDLAIIQSDVPEWIAGRLKKNKRPGHALRKFLVKVKYLFPLFNEEVHIVTRRGITSLQQLKDKKITTGSSRSGTFLTVGHLFQQLDLDFKAVHASISDAMALLGNGEVDAIALVAGSPVQSIKMLKGNDFHLLPISVKSLSNRYIPAEIPAGTYPWHKKDVSTIAVRALLVTFDYPEDAEVCRKLQKFSKVVRNNLPFLKRKGHPIWHHVDFNLMNYNTRNFLRSHCATQF